MTDEIQAIVAEVNEKFDRIVDENFYEQLGVTEKASVDEVRDNFRNLAKRFHPDRYSGVDLPDDVREKMKRLITQISHAQTVLTDPKKREDYDATLAMQAAGIPTDIGTIVEAESHFRAGVKLLDQGKYRAALDKLDTACKTNPAEPEFAATAAYCKYWTLPRDAADRVPDRHAVKMIVDHLSDYLADNPKNDTVCVFLAIIAKSEKNMTHAIEYFQEAMAINPNNIVAARELRLFSMRKQKEGFFKRLFGKLKK